MPDNLLSPSRTVLLFGLSFALAAQGQANAQAASGPVSENAAFRQPVTMDEVDRILGPLVLTRPLAAQTVQFLLREAESQYRFGNPVQALQGYQTIVAVAPDASKAWLRIGNLHHQAARLSPALEAYRRSAESADANDSQSRQKALMNMLLIHLDGAEHALDRLESVSASGSASPAGTAESGAADVKGQLQALKGQVASVQSRSSRRIALEPRTRQAEGL